MGVQYSHLRSITVMVCKDCKALNFPGCKSHKQLLSLSYGVEGIHTRCGGSRCEVNTQQSKWKYLCANCSKNDFDVFRVTMDEKHIESATSAFVRRSGIADTKIAKYQSSLLICTACSYAALPIINDRLCVHDMAHQLIDDSGQAVDLNSWKSRFLHCVDKCAGSTRPELVGSIQVVIIYSELEYARKRIKYSPPPKQLICQFPLW